MAAAESLKAIHGVGTNVQDTLKAMEDRMRDMEGMLRGVGNKLQGVDDRGENIGDNAINSAQIVSFSISILTCYAVRCRDNSTTGGSSQSH